MKCLIADDEHLARKLISAYAEKIPNLEVVALCENAATAISALQSQDIDLMFLDIQMPDLTGLELIKTLRNKPMVILITAYAEYALEGYQLDVIDYLVKPVAFERFVQAVNKAADLLALKQKASQSEKQQTDSPDIKVEKDHFFVKVDYKLVRINYDEILYVEGMREYVNIQTAAKRHIVYYSMKNMETVLGEKFVRCHKSYIVALDKISATYGNVIEVGEKEIPIGKSYKEGFVERISTLG